MLHNLKNDQFFIFKKIRKLFKEPRRILKTITVYLKRKVDSLNEYKFEIAGVLSEGTQHEGEHTQQHGWSQLVHRWSWGERFPHQNRSPW